MVLPKEHSNCLVEYKEGNELITWQETLENEFF